MLNAVQLRNRVIALAVCCLIAATARAQDALPLPPSSPEFLSRFDFTVSLATLGSNDPRFSWTGRASADFDVVDYVKGRTSFLAQYDVVLGNQLRPFDPNQGNYNFEGSSSWRLRKTEVAVVFHHLSRHLSDRQNFRSISYNELGGRVLRHFDFDKASLDLRAEVEKVVRHEFLDYSWTSGFHLTARRSLTPTFGVFGHGDFQTYAVDSSIAQRSRQNGGHLEGGVRVKGTRASVEFFAGWEQVVDAYPLERVPQGWSFVGLRLGGAK